MNSLCPCGSGRLYEDCCRLYHKGIFPENALLLMRSRYSAYALCLPSYIIETTHPDHSEFSLDFDQWKEKIILFSQNTTFERLEILDFIDGEDKALVAFSAYLRQGEDDVGFKETSHFEKVGGKWLYKGGRVEKLCDPQKETHSF